MQNISKVVDEFGAYLILYKKLSVATYNAYKHDINSFIGYLQDNQIDIESICENNIKQYFEFLQTKKASSSAAARSAGALKLFTKFLHEKHGQPDYSDIIKVDKKFPFVCSAKDIKQIISNFEAKYYGPHRSELSYEDLKNYVMFYLLSMSGISIGQLITIRFNDVKLDKQSIIVAKKDSNKTKNINLTLNFFSIMKDYLKQIPWETEFLFSVKLGDTIHAISKQSVWASMRLFISKSKHTLNLDTESHLVDKEFQEIYKKMHPRS